MKIFAIIFSISLLVVSCTNSDNKLPEFAGSWVLASYSLEDGMVKLVPNNVQVGISTLSDETINVRYALCGTYQIMFHLDNDVLTTFNPVSPEGGCTAFYDDEDGYERSEFLLRAFYNTQTIVELSPNFLAITTIENSKLEFKRFEK